MSASAWHDRNRRGTPSIRRAFTLLEVLMVLLILAILGALVLGLSRHARETSQRARALADLGELHHALARYFSVHDAYPVPANATVDIVDDEDDPDFLMKPPPWAPETDDPSETNRWKLRYYLPPDFTGLDPWGEPYRYHHSTNAPLHYQLYSLGPRNPGDQIPEARIHYRP